jgi:hypothetical protein
MSHIAVAVWCVAMAAIAAGISRTAIGVNYIVTCFGIFTACAVFPFYSTLLWPRQNKIAVVFAPILGSIVSISSWLGSAKALYGEVTIASTNGVIPLVIGNVVSLLSGVFFSVALTFLFGKDNFDWSQLQTRIHVARDEDVKGITEEQLRQQEAAEHLTPEAITGLKRARKQAILATVILFFSMMVLWPMPMVGTSYIFSKNFFRGWVVSFAFPMLFLSC